MILVEGQTRGKFKYTNSHNRFTMQNDGGSPKIAKNGWNDNCE